MPLDSLISKRDEEAIEKRAQELLCKVSDMRSIRVGELDLGIAVMSTLVSMTRDCDVNPNEYLEEVDGLARAALTCYYGTINLIDKENLDLFFIFNGRHAGVRGVLRACQKLGTKFVVHEGGHTEKHYALFEQATPHDIEFATQRIESIWNENETNRDKDGQSFFADRRRRDACDLIYISFIESQKKGEMPPGWDDAKRNVVIFCSSEDEFVAIGEEWSGPIYDSQIEGLERIAEEIECRNDETTFYLRIHPNLANLKTSFFNRLLRLKEKNVKIILPDSSVDSYALMEQADLVVSFGSSAGIEAVYWGTPSILLGRCYYYNLEATYNPKTHEEAVDMLFRSLEPKPIIGALKYGNYLKNFGIEYKTARVVNAREVYYRGKNLNGNWLHHQMLKFRKRRFGTTIEISQRKAEKLRRQRSRN